MHTVHLFLLRRPHPTSTLFPYTTLFRSRGRGAAGHREPPIRDFLREEVPGPRFGSGRAGLYWKRGLAEGGEEDRKSTRLNSSHLVISYAVFCLKKKKEREGHGVVNT